LTITQLVNLMVYVTHLLVQEVKIPHPFQLCGVDSTDLASSCCPVPLATLNVGLKKVRIYAEVDADCGKRRKKRNVGVQLSAISFQQKQCVKKTNRETSELPSLRKHMERSYNLFKHRAGLEHLRLKSQRSVMAAVTFVHLTTVFLEVARYHQTADKEHRPKQLQLAA